MSGAMGDENDPQTGEPIEPAEAAVDEAEQTGEPGDRADVGTGATEGGSAGASVGEPSNAAGEAPGDDADDAGDAAPEGDASAEQSAAPKEPAAETAAYEFDDDVAAARTDEGAQDEEPGLASHDAPEASEGGTVDDAATDVIPSADGEAATVGTVGDDAATDVIPSADDEAGAVASAGDEAATDVIPSADDATETEVIGSASGDAATDVLPSADAVPEPDAGGEPDYAALAAELEEFEARQAAAAAPAPGADREAPGSGWFEQAPETFRATEPGEPLPDDAPTEAVEPADPTAATVAATAVLPSEPASTEDAPAAGEKQSAVIFETYEPPRKRGNRVAALLIGVPATIAFAILYTVVDLAWAWFQNEVALESIVPDLLGRIVEPAFWIPVATFFLAFWLVGVIVNRGRAGWWVILGFLVALATYAGFVCAPIVTYPFWLMTPNDAMGTIEELWLNPVAIGTFIIAREVTVWFGAWVAGRGRRMKRMNAEDKAEYDRAVASGE